MDVFLGSGVLDVDCGMYFFTPVAYRLARWINDVGHLD